ncbi:MAG: hypothetical protein KDD06_29355, partial [Phaeodactylibacter sp.]|nr:hypothetical protein [Phaeodactylibacter sp.]
PPLPESGDQPDVTTFYSIQNEFPEVYGLREGEIVGTAPPLRHAQARQLKGYLLFFEQLMLNYCAQLDNIQLLFSIRPEVDQTYFFQPLYDVPAARNLFMAFLSEVDGVSLEAGEQAWQTFKQNGNNGYIQAQKEYAEDEATFLRRRNQFTGHLLARFAEDLSNYSSWSIAQNGGQISPALINDKLAFLNGFSSLAHSRATAFDYSATRTDEQGNSTPDVWDSENVSGFEKRVAAKLGISGFRRRSLATSAGPDAEEGLHLVEHLLLRPGSEDSDRMEAANLQREEGAPPLIMIPDPYPFQLSIFLPGWAARFQDEEFRAVVERTLREELPAHLFSWIYWVELNEEALIPTVFTTFENTFRLWLENLHPDNPEDTRNNFVKAFNELAKSKYATLANTYQPFEL